MRLREKVAIVTGGASGIGRATATLFAKEGAKVVIADVARDEGAKTAKAIAENNGVAIFVETDVSKASNAKRMVETTVKEYGKIDILFNNAGVYFEKTLADTTEEEWNRVIDVNLKSVFLCSKYAIPKMLPNKGGVIINTASILGLEAQARMAAYCASKAGVVLLTKTMALDYGPYNIRVNCVCPGTIETSMHKAFLANLADPDRAIQEMLKNIPLRRFGQPEDVARAALFLASEESSYLTGVALLIDGGQMHI